jgi:hypothetical protein
MWMILPVLWSASTQFPISSMANWKRRMSMTSPVFSPIWTRSPTENGFRVLINSQPAMFVSGSFKAMARPAVNKPRKAPNLAKADIQTLLIRTILMRDRARPIDLFHWYLNLGSSVCLQINFWIMNRSTQTTTTMARDSKIFRWFGGLKPISSWMISNIT